MEKSQPELMNLLSRELGKASQGSPQICMTCLNDGEIYNANWNNEYLCLPWSWGFALVVHMAFTGGPVEGMILHYLEGKAGGRERGLVDPKISQDNTEMPIAG